jgi:uncharacterized protein (TIGR03435 family)
MLRVVCFLSVILPAGLFGQAAAPAFEVASIRLAAATDTTGRPITLGMRVDGAQISGRLALKDFIGIAYRVKPYQISGPDWLGSVRFDIAATMPPGGTAGQVPEMLQSLFQDRFELKIHREKKDFPVYVLEIAKSGLKVHETPETEADKVEPNAPFSVTGTGSAQGIAVDLGRGSSYTFGNNRFEAKKLHMADVAATLERFLDRPVVDQTGLSGRYDFGLDVTEEDFRVMLIRGAVNSGVTLPPQALRVLDAGAPASLFDSLEKLGLKLDPGKAPLDVIVVDSARKTPTDN